MKLNKQTRRNLVIGVPGLLSIISMISARCEVIDWTIYAEVVELNHINLGIYRAIIEELV
jgi:hypothetical protein